MEEYEEQGGFERRKVCTEGCGRPITVCLCNHLPSPRLQTSTKILILQHPHELRHKLATAPLLAKCLLNCTSLVGRRLRLGSSPLIDSLSNVPPPSSPTALFLFPGDVSSPSLDLHDWVSLRSKNSDGFCNDSLILIVFDGTWNHAKEMVKASLPFLSKFAIQVSLSFDVRLEGPSIFDSDLTLRKEPYSGCVSTMEAVARALRLLEPRGAEIEERLLDVLRAMVRLQASKLKPMKPRPKMLKKGKNPCLLEQ